MRSLATGPWTAAQVADVLKAGTGRYGCRFEILDHKLDKVGDLDGEDGNGAVIAAKVDQDIDRDVKQQLEIELTPDARLVDQTFNRYVKAWFRVGMPNQTEIEFPLGVYLWATPQRTLESAGARDTEPLGTWTVTLGDRNHLLDLGGPPLSGFSIAAGATVTQQVRRILARMGMDPSGVVASPETTARKLLFDLRTDAEAKKLKGVTVNAEPSTWLRILHRLTDSIGYESVYFDGDGRPIVEPSKNMATADPDVIYETSADSIITPPAEISREIDQIANRVTIRNHGPGGALQVVTADANKYAPTHPMAQKNLDTKLYIDVVLEEPMALAGSALRARAVRALLRRLSCLQHVQVRTMAWPVHESFDIVGLQWDGDQDYNTGAVHHEKGWSLDLFTGEMEHTLRRLFRAA